MKTIQILLLSLIAIAFTSCSQEDDINEIFMGKNWYILNGAYNGYKFSNEELASLFKEGTNCYVMQFSQNTFSGVLSGGSTFNGLWSVNGKTRSMNLLFDKEPNTPKELDYKIYKVFISATKYEGDANVLTIKQDEANYILLGTKK